MEKPHTARLWGFFIGLLYFSCPVVWLYPLFCLSFREVKELLAERGIIGTYETIRQWYQKITPAYAGTLKKPQGRLGDTWHLDEIFIAIQRKQLFFWLFCGRQIHLKFLRASFSRFSNGTGEF